MLLDSFSALELFKNTIFGVVKKGGEDLSNRQMAVLMTVYLEEPPHTVKALSTNLKVSKPAITRAIDKLSDMGFLKRKVDEKDNRNVLLQRTVKGSIYLREFGDLIVKNAKDIKKS